MVALCAATAGMQHEELLRETLAVFGGRRVTPGIGQRLEWAVEEALKAQRLAVSGGRYEAGS